MWLDNASSIDMLFYSPYADTVVKFAKNKSLTPLTIGLYGSWGAGKSSLLNIINKKLSELPENEKVECISLNAWQFEGYEDAKIAIMEALLKALKENKSFKDKAKDKIRDLIKRVDFLKLGKSVVKKGLPYALGALTGNPLPIALNLSADLANSKELIDKISTFKNEYVKAPEGDSEIENIRKFRDEFEQMLKEVDSVENLTVIIDDLDRCAPDRIIDTLEAIKLFLSVEKTTFIIAVDQRIIEYAVKTKYSEIDGYELSSDYIEKIIQLPIKIPELSPKDIENYLLLLICQLHMHNEKFEELIAHIYSNKFLLVDKAINFKQIEAYITEQGFTGYCDDLDDFTNDANTIMKIRCAVSSSLKGNPRQAKRFLNTFFVRKNLASLYFNDELDISIIAKLLALEIIDINLFKKLNEWNKSYNGEIAQLKKLELLAHEEISDIDEDLKKWTKSRIINWLLSEPNELYKQDLSKYFYLSRESLVNSDSIAFTFTEEERHLLNRIVGCEKGQEDTRIGELQTISQISQERIIGEVLNKIDSNDIELSLVASIYVKYEAFQEEICSKIKANTNIRVSIVEIPHFKRMYLTNNTQITILLDYLEKKSRLDKKSRDMITESDPIIAKAVPRG